MIGTSLPKDYHGRDDPNGESPAVEVLQFKDKNGYFASKCKAEIILVIDILLIILIMIAMICHNCFCVCFINVSLF